MRRIILLSALIYGTAVWILGGQVQYKSGLYEAKETKVSLIPVRDAAFTIPSFDIPVFIDQYRDGVRFKENANFVSDLYDSHLVLLQLIMAVQTSFLNNNPLFIVFHNLRL